MSDHNPIYHLKDAYYFEVPKPLWRQGWKSLDDVPAFLRAPFEVEGATMPSVAEFNAAMDGKILIPQPFGTLDSLYEKKSGFCISKYMILELLVGLVLLLVFTRLAKQLSSGGPPRGWFCARAGNRSKMWCQKSGIPSVGRRGVGGLCAVQCIKGLGRNLPGSPRKKGAAAFRASVPAGPLNDFREGFAAVTLGRQEAQIRSLVNR
jgi:hypothetical protein